MGRFAACLTGNLTFTNRMIRRSSSSHYIIIGSADRKFSYIVSKTGGSIRFSIAQG